MLYAPHGVDPADLAMPVWTLALLHGLRGITLPRAQLKKGAHDGLKVQKMLDAKCWVGTHDEVKVGGGESELVLNWKVTTLMEALRERLGEKERVVM